MAQAKLNPFMPARWEHHSHGRPLIWFTQTAEQLASDKSVYVSGSRGSGKTTLLKSICWDDLIHNPSLRLQRTLEESRHIGVYIRFPDHVSGSMGYTGWKNVFPDAPDPDWEFFRFFSFAVELICIERALHCVHELRLLDRVELDPSQELRLIEDILDEHPALNSFCERLPKTFQDFGRVCRNIVRRMNEASSRGTVAELVGFLPPREPNDLLSYVISGLSGISRMKSVQGDLAPGFKFCLDDCEVLNDLQRKSVNTLVRKSQFPVSWVICSVGVDFNSSDTFLPQQPLSEADRRVISLYDRSRSDFRNLCEAVASLRTYFSLQENERPRLQGAVSQAFNLVQRLGAHTVNNTIAVMVRRSTSAFASTLKDAASLLSSELSKMNVGRTDDELPYYETYLLLSWTGREDSFTLPKDQDLDNLSQIPTRAKLMIEPRFQAWMRRKMVGAMLQIGARIGFQKYPVGGSNMVVSLADGSIRDFLEIMAEIYARYAIANETVSNKESRRAADAGKVSQEEILRRFVHSRTKVALRHQTDAIYQASKAFFDVIPSQTESHPAAVRKLVEALGIYTGVLQSSATDVSVLATAERGVFVVNVAPPLNEDADARKSRLLLLEVLRQAELAGYVRNTRSRERWLDQDVNELRTNFLSFRLHRRLAPHFGFSYRGAYEPVRLDAISLAQACQPLTSSKAWVRQAGRRTVTQEQLTFLWAEESFDE